jgi:hypothetical protein
LLVVVPFDRFPVYIGWFSLGLRDWFRLIPFGVAVGGLSYLSIQVSTQCLWMRNPGFLLNPDSGTFFAKSGFQTQCSKTKNQCSRSVLFWFGSGYHSSKIKSHKEVTKE